MKFYLDVWFQISSLEKKQLKTPFAFYYSTVPVTVTSASIRLNYSSEVPTESVTVPRTSKLH